VKICYSQIMRLSICIGWFAISRCFFYRLVELVSYLSYRVTVEQWIQYLCNDHIYVVIYMVPVFPCCIYVSTVMPWLSGQGQTFHVWLSACDARVTQYERHLIGEMHLIGERHLMLNYYYHTRAIWGHYCIVHYDRIKS
jgi:hypothetical protein